LETLHPGLVQILAFTHNRSPKLIGTGFIVAANSDHAIVITAAHNFHEGVRNAQFPKDYRHPSALPEFLKEISIDPSKVRAVHRKQQAVEVCVIEFVAWDEASDLAVMKIVPQDRVSNRFDTFFRMKRESVEVGSEVGLIGYGDMAVVSEQMDGDKGQFSTESRVVFRRGVITKIHPEGYSLCRTRCVETNIPVFSGMSGGPVFIIPDDDEDMIPFGLVSFDPEPEGVSAKYDRSIAGRSVAAMLPTRITEITTDKRGVLFNFGEKTVVLKGS
tara:strand:+ start:2297 stop:3115 length:819 start_codon:yes stop_codon:yes gene_type:complete